MVNTINQLFPYFRKETENQATQPALTQQRCARPVQNIRGQSPGKFSAQGQSFTPQSFRAMELLIEKQKALLLFSHAEYIES